MNAEFSAVIQQLIAEQSKDVLLNAAKCKAFLADYTRGDHKKETRLLLQVIEAGMAKELEDAEELAICKAKLVRNLQDDFFIAENAATDVINMLAFVLRGDMAKPATFNSGKPIIVENKSVSIRPELEEDIVRRSLEIWICGRCNTANDFERDFCKKCGKEFNPPLGKTQKSNYIKLRPALWERKKK
jgi:ribosomal protein L40E